MRCIVVLVIGVLALNNVAGFSAGRNYGSDEISSNEVISGRFKRQSEEGAEPPPPAEGEAPPAEGEASPAEGEAPPAEGEAPPAEGEAPAEAPPAEQAPPEAPPAEEVPPEAPPAEGEAPPETPPEAPPAEAEAPPEAPPAEEKNPAEAPPPSPPIDSNEIPDPPTPGGASPGQTPQNCPSTSDGSGTGSMPGGGGGMPSMDDLKKKAEEIGNKVKSLWGCLVKGVTDLVDTVSSNVG